MGSLEMQPLFSNFSPHFGNRHCVIQFNMEDRALLDNFLRAGKEEMLDLGTRAKSLRTRLEAGVKVDSSHFLQVMSNQEKQTKELEDSIVKIEEQAAEQTSLKELVNQVLYAYQQQLHETRRIEDHLRNYGYTERYPNPAPENLFSSTYAARNSIPEIVGSLQINSGQVTLVSCCSQWSG